MENTMRQSGFLRLAFLVMLAWSLGMLLGPMVEVVSVEFGLASETLIGNISGVFLLVSGILAFGWTFLENWLNKRDPRSRKRLLIVVTLILIGGVFLTSTASTYSELFTYQMITAVGCAAIIPFAYAMVMDLTPSEGRARAFGWLEIAAMIGASILGYLMPGLFIAVLPWRVPFWLVGILGIIILGALLRMAEPKRGGQEQELSEVLSEGYEYNFRVNKNGLKSLMNSWTNRLLLILTIIFNVASGSIVYYFVRMMVNDHGFSSTMAVGLYVAIYSSQAIGSIFWTKRADIKFQRQQEGKVTVLFQGLLIGPMFMIAGYSLSFTYTNLIIVLLFAILLALGAFFLSGLMPIAFTILGEVNPPEMRTTVFALNNLAQTIGRGGGILLMGSFFTFWGEAYHWGYVVMSCLFLGGIGILIPLFKLVPNELGEISQLLRKRAQNITGRIIVNEDVYPFSTSEKIQMPILDQDTKAIFDSLVIEEEIYESILRNVMEIEAIQIQLWHQERIRKRLTGLLDK
ncbi:MAG: MFS transporter [Candidatus Helarchaeota archaeon]